MWKSIAVTAAAVALVATGCSSSNSSDQPATSGDGHEAVLQTYFKAFGTDSPKDMKPMLEASAPDSPAYTYAEHQINLAEANRSQEGANYSSTVTVDGETVTMVQDGLPEDASEELKQEATTVYQDFTYANDGKITNWVADPGGELAPRIAAENSKSTSNKVKIDLQTAYETNSGDLMVTYEVVNGSNVKTSVTPKGYIDQNKRQTNVIPTPYQVELPADVSAVGSVRIEEGEFGGTLTFNAYQQADTYENWDVKLKVTGPDTN